MIQRYSYIQIATLTVVTIAQNAATHPGLKSRVRGRFICNQAARWSNNKENDQKMADNAYFLRVYVLYTCVS